MDDYTIEVSSSIPLLNIAVFAQGSQAKITAASYRNESDIPISRKVSLSYPRYSDLVGGAFLLGDSQTVIGSGTYYITFDQKVNLSDLIILFEPALEMRMVITVNGVVVDDLDELNNVMEGDVVSVSCKIYEMGTDTEVDPDLMPPGTKFEITISEDGQVVEQVSGENMSLEDYILKHINTEVKASLLIDGFNPIDCVAKFTPSVYVPKVVYTLEPSFGGDVKHVKFDEIANNQDLTICFTVYADGVPLTDLNAVKAMNPTITVSPQGNGGDVTYTDDGKIVFTPTSASMTTTNDGSFEVEVTCTLDDGTTATQVYTVLIATYEVIPVSPSQSVKRTELYQNQVGVSFYITKDGVKLDKAAVEKHISVMLNQEYESLKTAVVVSPDGTITVIFGIFDHDHTVRTFGHRTASRDRHALLGTEFKFRTLAHKNLTL